jgi:hypothetical protein
MEKGEKLIQHPISFTTSSKNSSISMRNIDISKQKDADKWTSVEDLYILKGFQSFGEKYPLISLFFLPHRSPYEIRNR